MELLGQNGPQLHSLSSKLTSAYVGPHSFSKTILVSWPLCPEMAAEIHSDLTFLALPGPLML